MQSPLKARVKNDNNKDINKKEKDNRKILDLEISNNALLTINQSQEAMIKKQSKTIKQLKAQLEELQQLQQSVRRSPSPQSLVNEEDELDDENYSNDTEFQKLKSNLLHLIDQGLTALNS